MQPQNETGISSRATSHGLLTISFGFFIKSMKLLIEGFNTSAAQFDDFEAEILAKMMATKETKPGDNKSKFDDI